MAQPQEFPFDIMDVAELLHLHIRRRQADSVYADCPICGDKRGKMNINFAKNLWRCNYCNEGGGMLSLYGKVYGISNSEAYREICDTLQNGLTAPEYTVKELPGKAAVEQSALASPQEIHQKVGHVRFQQPFRHIDNPRKGIAHEMDRTAGGYSAFLGSGG